MRMMKVRFLSFVLTMGVFSAPQAWAYTVPSYWCSGLPCTWSAYLDQSCSVVSEACNRSEGAPSFSIAGTPGTITSGATLKCNTCCDACKGQNPPTETHKCETSLTLSTSRTFSFTIAPGISAELWKVIEVELKFQFGWSGTTTYQNSVTVGSANFPSCKIGRYRAFLAIYTNAECRIFSSFNWVIGVSGPNPPCPTPSFSSPCNLGYYSTCTSTRWGDAEMQWLGNTDCP